MMPPIPRGIATNTLAGFLIGALLLVTSAVPVRAQSEPAAPAAQPAGVIRGTLVDANGEPLVGYKLRVVGPDAKVHESVPTGADGRYEITELTPGTYSYEIIDPQGDTVPVRIPPVRLEAGMSVTQPIAIVPRRGKKGPAVAWALGGAAVVAAALIIAGNDDDEDSASMSPSGP